MGDHCFVRIFKSPLVSVMLLSKSSFNNRNFFDFQLSEIVFFSASPLTIHYRCIFDSFSHSLVFIFHLRFGTHLDFFNSTPKQQLCKEGVSNNISGKFWFNNRQRLLFNIVLTKTFDFVLFHYLYIPDICLNLWWFQRIIAIVMSFTCHQELVTMGYSFGKSFNYFFVWGNVRDNAGLFLSCIFSFKN